MTPDVEELAAFYAGALGGAAKRALRAELRRLWPNVGGMTVVGLGYAIPLLRPFCGEARAVMAAMPAAQGATHWPRGGPSATVLVDEGALPWASGVVDRLLLAHTVETSHALPALLAEAWRVLGPYGRLIVVAPGRAGVWARTERTPFGHGRSFTSGQLSRLLAEHDFSPTATGRALFFPPMRWRMALAAAPAVDQIGRRWLPQIAGAVLVEAEKQVYAGAKRVRRQVVSRELSARPAIARRDD